MKTRRTVVITGSTRGIGFGLAEYFLTKGCNVVLNGTSENSVQKALSSLGAFSGRVIGIPGDVSVLSTHEHLVSGAVEKFGTIDIWINNAGISQPSIPFYEMEANFIKKIMDINILGVVYGTQVAYKTMEKKNGGFIYNMEGLGSDGRMIAGQTFYGGSKRALRYLTRSMAKEMNGKKVKLCTLSPGMVVTDLLMSGIDKNSDKPENVKKIFNILADRVEDVVAFLGYEILHNKKHRKQIIWLTNAKIIRRFLTAPFVKRNVLDTYEHNNRV